jgi:hypothetical protein
MAATGNSCFVCYWIGTKWAVFIEDLP